MTRWTIGPGCIRVSPGVQIGSSTVSLTLTLRAGRKSSVSSTISEPPSPPTIDITFSALWKEVRPGGIRRRRGPREEEEEDLLGMEEGRAVG